MSTRKTQTPPLNPQERRAVAALAGIYGLRMLGLFLILPVFALYAEGLEGETPLLIGLAIGAYGLTQALLQIPAGMLSDRIGRKPVIFTGLAIFALGSAIAAMSTEIHWVILGRAIQGAGAVSAAITALTADLTRDEVRTRAMAGIGASIGLAFGIALVAGPMLAHLWGLSGVFWTTAALAFGGILVLWLLVPTPERSCVHRDAEPVAGQLAGVLRDGQLLRLDYGIFSMHVIMTAIFLVVPPAMAAAGLKPEDHWKVYLPVLLLAIAIMVPLVIQAEAKGRLKPIFLGAVATVGVTALVFSILGDGLWVLVPLLVVFFAAVNLLEALLPSMVSKLARAGAKGTAMGVYSTSQFFGAFIGGVLGGVAHQVFGDAGVFVLVSIVAALWLAVAASMAAPERVSTQVIRLGPDLDTLSADALAGIQRQLLAVRGVRDALVVPEEGVAYLKVDSRELDSATLAGLSG